MKFFRLVLIWGITCSIFLHPRLSAGAQDAPPELPIYIVQSGDILSLIAFKLNVSLNDLISVNNISDPNAISAGTELRVPGYEGITGILTFKTASIGDDLSHLSKQYQIPESDLIRLNNITSPQQVFIGTEIIVPQARDQEDTHSFLPIKIVNREITPLEISAQHNLSVYSLLDKNDLPASWQMLPQTVVFNDNEEQGINSISSAISEISLQPLPVQQGATLSLALKTSTPLEISGHLGEHELVFFNLGDNVNVTLQGMAPREPVGLAELYLLGMNEGERIFEYNQLLLVNPGNFGGDVLQLTVDPQTIDPATINAEDQVIQEYITQFTPTKMWEQTFQYPVDDPCIRSWYGGDRIYNGVYTYYHTGVDFGICANNLNIYAPASGRIVYTGGLTITGNTTIIDHGLGVFTGFFHQSEFLVGVGDPVAPGQIIGTIGNTGRSTGPHLHWQVWVNGESVNPLAWTLNDYP